MIALAVELAFDPQHGELVGHHAHAPARLVGPAAVAVGQNLRRRLVFVAVVEWADALGGNRNRLPDEIAGAFGAFGGDDDPSPRDWVLT